MSIAKRLKRAKKRKKNKWLKRARKIQRMYYRELQHSELLSKFDSFIEKEYQRGEITLYRWSHSPYTEDDFRPQIFQSFSDRDIDDVEVPSLDDSIKKIKNYVGRFTLSHFRSELEAIQGYQEQLNRIKNSDHPETVEGFIENKGSYVIKCDYKEDDMLYGKTSTKGHVDILPCRGLDPGRVIDKTFKCKINIEL